MTSRVRLSTRIAAALAHEVSADTAEAYRRAGSGVYDLLLECEQRRGAGGASGQADWRPRPARTSR